MTQALYSHQFDNGLVLLAESMDWLESAAFSLQVPAGYADDPPERLGLSNFLCDMVQRGCGARDSRQFIEDLDRFGVDRSASVSVNHTSFGAAMLAGNLASSLAIYADLVQRPHLPPGQLEESRQVCWQEIAAAEDDLPHKTMSRLKLRRYGEPWGRTSTGSLKGIQAIEESDVQRHFHDTFQPDGAILSVAGRVDWPSLRDLVGELFAEWTPRSAAQPEETEPSGGYEYMPFDSQQTQIGVAFPSVPYSHPDYFQARGAVGVLSDGMSARLFTEIREKRGLCYTVYASCHSLRNRGSVLSYAATSTENAQQTLDVLLAELRRLPDGVEDHELNRLKARIKSSLIMQQESSAARSYAMAADWFHLGRVLTMAEVGTIIDQLTCDSINEFLAAHPPRDFTVVTLGEKKLEVSVGAP